VRSSQPLPLKLRRSDGSLVPVLMSGAELPARLGRVFIASDLRAQNRIERMQVLTKLFQQLATEIRVPLALADSFLRRGQAVPEGELPEARARELMDKAVRQIRKADVPLEAVVRFAVQMPDTSLNSGVFDVRDALYEVIAELPAHDARETEVQINGNDTLIRAPRHELLFCVRSLLAYLLRHRAQVEKVILDLTRPASRMRLSLALRSSGEGDVQEPGGETPAFDFTLTEPVITDLMDRMGGSYRADAGRRRFWLSF
jgi:hypothetical protein